MKIDTSASAVVAPQSTAAATGKANKKKAPRKNKAQQRGLPEDSDHDLASSSQKNLSQHSLAEFSAVSEHGSAASWHRSASSSSLSSFGGDEVDEEESPLARNNNNNNNTPQLKSALKRKKRVLRKLGLKKSVSFQRSNDSDSPGPQPNDDDDDVPHCTVHEIPTWDDLEDVDLWLTAERIRDAKEEWNWICDDLQNNERCVQLVEKLISYKKKENVERVLKKLQKHFPDALGNESLISENYRDMCYFHRHLVLDKVDQLKDSGTSHTEEGRKMIRATSLASSRKVRRLAEKLALET